MTIQALSSTLDLQEVFERILSELQRVVPFDSASVQQLNGEVLEIIGGRGFSNLEQLLGVCFDLLSRENPNHLVIQNRKPIILKMLRKSILNFSVVPTYRRQFGPGWGFP